MPLAADVGLAVADFFLVSHGALEALAWVFGIIAIGMTALPLLLTLVSLAVWAQMRDERRSVARLALGIVDVIYGSFCFLAMLWAGVSILAWLSWAATFVSAGLCVVGVLIIVRHHGMPYTINAAARSDDASRSSDDVPPSNDDDGWESEHPPPSSFS